jgi:hypothetical protein
LCPFTPPSRAGLAGHVPANIGPFGHQGPTNNRFAKKLPIIIRKLDEVGELLSTAIKLAYFPKKCYFLEQENGENQENTDRERNA